MDQDKLAGQVAQQAGQAARGAERQAREAAESRPMRLLARGGLIAYGVVHLLLAFLAARVALGDGSIKVNKSGALQTVAAQPGGPLLLWTIAVGMAALAVWRLAEGIWGHRREQGRRRTMKRAFSFGEGGLAVALGWSAAQYALGGSKQGGKTVEFTARVLDLPGGRILVGAVGLAIIAAGAYLVRHGVGRRFVSELDLGQVDQATRGLAVRVGQVGWAGLGAVYGLLGGFVFLAAVTYDPAKAAGLDTALKTLAGQPYGRVLLLLAAVGLACFGVYCMLDARYRRG